MHSLLQDATPEQREAIQHKDGAAFVSAAPGSGKTRVITYRCAYLLAQGVNPTSIVGITFTNKAANEMKTRMRNLVGSSSTANRVWLSTFHSFCARLLRVNPKIYRVPYSFNIADENDAKQLVTLAISQVTGKSEKDVRDIDGTGDIKHVRKWISGHKNALRSPADLKELVADDEHAVAFSDFIPYYREYNMLLGNSNLLDFDDLIMKTVLGLRRNPMEQKAFADHLHYLMVDEWQDTNFAQFELVKMLSHLRQNVFVVGDDDQSIYGWRGADEENSDRYYKFYNDVKTYFLQKNFRSVPGIAAVANEVIQNNKRKHEKTIVTNKEGGAKPQLVHLEDREHEASFVIGTIRDLVRRKKASWKDFAVIYRIRSWSRALEDAAVAKNVPYRVIGALNFYNRAVVKDILCYARLLVTPEDNASFTRIYNKPPRYIGPVNFARFAAIADEKKYCLMKTLRMGLYKDVAQANSRMGFRSLKALYKKLREIGPNEVAPVIRCIIKFSGYEYYLDQMRDSDRRDRMMEDLEELRNAAASFDARTRNHKRKGVRAFLEHTSLMQDQDNDEDEDKVLMMTAHAAKGLEFPNVFLCGAIEGVLPLAPRADDGSSVLDPEIIRKHYEEERRVFYVAITRAEERLWVTYLNSRFYEGKHSEAEASRFCVEAKDTFRSVDQVQRRRDKRNEQPANYHPMYNRRSIIKDGGAAEIIRQKRAKNRVVY